MRGHGDVVFSYDHYCYMTGIYIRRNDPHK